MAAIICDKHGRQYCVFASPSVAALPGSVSRPPNKWVAVRLDLMGGPGYFWCDEDFTKSFPTEGQAVRRTDDRIHVQDEDLAFEIFSKLTPVCVKCYEEYLEENGRQRPEELFKE